MSGHAVTFFSVSILRKTFAVLFVAETSRMRACFSKLTTKFNTPAFRRYDITSRYYGSITKKNKNILRCFVLLRNPVALVAEVLRISNESARSSQLTTNSSSTENFAERVARICVSEEAVQIELAFEILEYLDEVKKESMVLGALELVEKCIEFGHIESAMTAYMRLHNIGAMLDLYRKELLISALATECRIGDIITILSCHTITVSDLVLSAEPLIMSGNVSKYSKLLNKYLDQKKNLLDPIQCPEEVSRIVRSIMSARLRRFFDSSEPSLEENEGMMDILTTLQSYYMRLSCSPVQKYADVLTSQSYFQARQLYEIEKERGLALTDNHVLTAHQDDLIDHLPEFETTGII